MQVGYDESSPFLEVGIRPAYHDLTDPADGYPLGSELIFLESEFRLYEASSQLQNLTLIGIQSIKPRTSFFSPMSWAVDVGAHRKVLEDTNPLAFSLHGSLGPAFEWGPGLIYTLVGGELQLSDQLEKGGDALLRSNVGLISHHRFGQLQLAYEYRHSVINGRYRGNVLFKQVTNLADNWALTMEIDHEHRQLKSRNDRKENKTVFELGAYWYF